MMSATQNEPPKNHSFGRRRLMGEGVWVALGQLASVTAGLIGMRLLTEFLAPEIYGQVALLLGWAMLVRMMGCSPLISSAFRFYPEFAQRNEVSHLRQLIGGILWSAGVISFGVIVVVGGIYAMAASRPWLPFVVLALMFSLEMLQMYEQNLLRAARRQRAHAIWNATVVWGKPLIAIAMIVLLGANASAVLFGYCLAIAVPFLVLRYMTQVLTPREQPEEEKPLPAEEAARYKQELWTYVLPLLPLGLVGWVHSLSDRYVIGGALGTEQAGLYVAVYGLGQRPYMMVEGLLQGTLMPAYNQALAAHDQVQERRLFRMWLGALVAVVAVGTVCFFFLNEFVVWLLLARSYASGAPLLPWLACGFAMLSIAHVFEWRLYSLKHTKFVLLGQSIAALASLAVMIPMVMFFGLWGAAVACPIYYAIYLFAMFALSRQAYRHYSFDSNQEKPT